VVDDNRDAADSLAMLLRIDGHTARVAGNGAGALRELEEFRPDVLLLDIGLPDMNGYELARRVRATAHGAGAVLIALTGWGQAEDKRRAAEAGFDEHFTKPVDPQMLSALLGSEDHRSRRN
jgi:DNA-binding response OmpR family regulator